MDSSSLRYVGNQVLLPASVLARYGWAEQNKEKGAAERRQKEVNEQRRQKEKQELWQQTMLRRSASLGRVAASRDNLLNERRAFRREELAREQHAIAEKQRRLEEAQASRAELHAAKFRPITADQASTLSRYDSRSSLSTPQHRRAPSWIGAPRESGRSKHAKYLSYVKMQVPEGCKTIDTIPVSQSTHARWAWAEDNRQKGVEERRIKEANEERRAAEQRELCRKVGLSRIASAGRVAASRAHLLATKREQRRAELANQQHALAEKARRLEGMRATHASVLAAKYRPITHEQYVGHLHDPSQPQPRPLSPLALQI